MEEIKENQSPDTAPENQAAPPVDYQAKINELQNFLSEREKELELLKPRVMRVEELENSLKSTGADLEKARGELGQAVGSYKSLVLTANPEVPPELISGASIQEVNTSLEKARAIVDKIKSSLTSPISFPTSIPAGAPPRSAPDWSSLSAAEKIKLGLSRK